MRVRSACTGRRLARYRYMRAKRTRSTKTKTTKRAQSAKPKAARRSASARGGKIRVKLTGAALGGIGSFVAVIHACRRAARENGWTEPRIAALYKTLQYGGGGRAGAIKRASRWFEIVES